MFLILPFPVCFFYKNLTFQSFRNKDDVLTLLIHLGYLAYDADHGTAFIPNEEIRSELASAIEEEYK